jgi:2-methylcitrate dehydratase PrpD
VRSAQELAVGENPRVTDDAYRLALTDWLACAYAGTGERAAQAMRGAGEGLLGEVAFAGVAGHVLDYDDTCSDGVAHVSAAAAPAALVLGAHLGATLQGALDAYAEGFEAMAAVAAASHPALYDSGLHPTTVCAPIGAAVAAAALLELPEAQREQALAISVLRAGGTRGAFGSDGKAIQVGLAAAAGVQAALLARAGAIVDPAVIHGPLGFEQVLGATFELPAGSSTGRRRAIERNWTKLYPSCLGTHSPIECAVQLRDDGHRLGQEPVEVLVHPVARQAAHRDVVDDGLAAKFSIPYCVAHTLGHGPPRVRDFARVDADTRELAVQVRVSVDRSLPEFGAVITVGAEERARIPCPRGAPERPASAADLATKLAELAGTRLNGLFDDLRRPAATALAAAGLAELP